MTARLQPLREAPEPEADVLEALRRFGVDAVSFLALESKTQHWSPEPATQAPRARVAYVDTKRAWVALGAPLAEPGQVASVARAFVDAARRNGRRACFFATESLEVEGYSKLLLGEQPLWSSEAWAAGVATHRRLREQIRRSRSKGVTVRRVDSFELEPGSAMRARVELLAGEWLRSRRMAPMEFLVALEPFHAAAEHRYFAAEHDGRLLGFLSAVPIYARSGWLVEDVLRSQHAPNGVTEALLDAVMRDVPSGACVTLGLTPLSGPIAPSLRIARVIMRPMFDFVGLRTYRQRLRPPRWQRVWMVYPASCSPVMHVLDALTAFGGGSLVRFAVRSIGRPPSGPPWALALPLVPWTLLLACLLVSGRADVFGFSSRVLAGWMAFDALLAAQLFWSATRPRRGRLAVSALAASMDAGWSVPHLVLAGLGRTVATATARSLAAFAPLFGAGILVWVALRTDRSEV